MSNFVKIVGFNITEISLNFNCLTHDSCGLLVITDDFTFTRKSEKLIFTHFFRNFTHLFTFFVSNSTSIPVVYILFKSIKLVPLQNYRLPPALDTLVPHVHRAFWLAMIWKKSVQYFPSPSPSPMQFYWVKL